MGKIVNAENKLDKHVELGQMMKSEECWRISCMKEVVRGKARGVV